MYEDTEEAEAVLELEGQKPTTGMYVVSISFKGLGVLKLSWFDAVKLGFGLIWEGFIICMPAALLSKFQR